MPDRVTAEPQGRTSFLVPDLPTTGLPTAGRSASAPAPTTAATAQTTAAQTTAAPAALRGREQGEPRHGRPTGRSARPTGRGARATGRAGASTGPVASATTASGSRTPGSSRTSGSTRPPARPGPRDRRWHQRRALGLPVGLLAAAVALAAAVVVGAWAGAPGHDVLTAAMASADRAAGPSAATPAAAAPAAADPTAGAATEAGEETGEAGGSSAAAAPAASADPSSAAASPPASAPAAAAPAAPASPRTAPLGDVTYEVYGTAKDTYVELGTEDSREERQDLGSSYTKTMTGSKDWPGQYVAVSSFDGAGGGSVGCRIKDADGTVLAEEESSTPGQPATCIVGAPAGIN
ncbi:hypothetical protein FHN55_00590 [Streptomyces sp. NP160]|nr:hypothetical protein FHN55_00590 [Streptomyces sp. NP160]